MKHFALLLSFTLFVPAAISCRDQDKMPKTSPAVAPKSEDLTIPEGCKKDEYLEKKLIKDKFESVVNSYPITNEKPPVAAGASIGGKNVEALLVSKGDRFFSSSTYFLKKDGKTVNSYASDAIVPCNEVIGYSENAEFSAYAENFEKAMSEITRFDGDLPICDENEYPLALTYLYVFFADGSHSKYLSLEDGGCIKSGDEDIAVIDKDFSAKLRAIRLPVIE